MSNLFIRTYTFLDGTTAYGSQVETEFGNLSVVLNNLNTGVTNWGIVSVLHATSVPLVADCSAGSQNIANFKNNSVIKASISSAGLLTAAGAAMGSNKITGLANGTAATDAATFGQIKYISTPSQTISTSNFATTSSTFQTTNLSASITPSSASSRVKISVSGVMTINAATGINAFASIFRGSTNLATGGNLDFARVRSAAAQQTVISVAMVFIDSPATTSSTTYTIKLKNSDNATTVEFGQSDDQVMILEEIV